VVFRNESTRGLTPAYEGVGLDHSVANQVGAAGGIVVENEADVVLLVNNFDELE
jgi:hypothetical protein